jgi:hypothetical protein
VHLEGTDITIDIGSGIRVEGPLYLKKRHNYRYRESYKGIRVVIPITHTSWEDISRLFTGHLEVRRFCSYLRRSGPRPGGSGVNMHLSLKQSPHSGI